MAQWIIEGADSTTGAARTVAVEAPDRATAEAVANEVGIFVARVRAAGAVAPVAPGAPGQAPKVITERTSKIYKGWMLMAGAGMLSSVGGCVLSASTREPTLAPGLMLLSFFAWASLFLIARVFAWWDHA